MTFISLVAPIFTNVRMYGALGNGSADDSSAIAAALLAASSAGGGGVFFPAGTYLTGNQTLYANVHLVGAGINATIIKLKNGVNADLFSAQTGSINLSASSGSGSAGSLYNFGLYNLTLDGNKANQSSGTSYPLRFYGYGYILENLRVRNGYSGGILSDWNGGSSSPGQDSMEAHWVNVKVHDCGGINVEVGGPHDSQIANLVIYNSGTHCLHIAPNASGLLFANTHCWGPNLGTSSVSYLIEAGYCQFINCIAEGSDTMDVVLLASDCTWSGGHIFASGSGASTCSGLQLGQPGSGTPYSGSILQSGGVPTYTQAENNRIDTIITGCVGTHGAIWFNTEQSNTVIARCDQSSGSYFTGSPNLTHVWINGSGLTPDGTQAKGSIYLLKLDAYSGFNVQDQAYNDVWNVNTHAGSYRFEMPNGTEIKMYSDAYSTPTLDFNNGVISFGSSLDTTIQRKAAATVGINGALVVGPSASTPTLANNGTINTAGVGVAKVTTSGAVTGAILQAGTVDAQLIIIQNTSGNSITFATSGTSHVAAGTGKVLAANSSTLLSWNATGSLWY